MLKRRESWLFFYSLGTAPNVITTTTTTTNTLHPHLVVSAEAYLQRSSEYQSESSGLSH